MICISAYGSTPLLQWSPGPLSWLLGPYPQNARKNTWWLVPCLYFVQKIPSFCCTPVRARRKSNLCPVALLTLTLWISVRPILEWAGAGTNVLHSKTVPSEDHAHISLQHILPGCWELFLSPGSRVMLSPELSGSSVTATGVEFCLFGRWDLASSSSIMTMKPGPRCCCVWSGPGGRMIWHLWLWSDGKRTQIQSWMSSWWGLRRTWDRPACHRGEINAIYMKD